VLVTTKYVLFVLRADNHGEGGTFALLGRLERAGERSIKWLTLALILAAGMLYAEGLITPAISVLSAVGGLGLVTTSLTPYIVPSPS